MSNHPQIQVDGSMRLPSLFVADSRFRPHQWALFDFSRVRLRPISSREVPSASRLIHGMYQHCQGPKNVALPFAKARLNIGAFRTTNIAVLEAFPRRAMAIASKRIAAIAATSAANSKMYKSVVLAGTRTRHFAPDQRRSRIPVALFLRWARLA